MFIGGYFFLIVVGALMRWAVTYHSASFDIQTAGLIIMIVGIIGLVISILFWFDGRGYAAPWRRSRYADGQAYCPPVQERVVHEHVVPGEVGPHELVVRDYVPPPRDDEAEDRTADWSEDDTMGDTAERHPSQSGTPTQPPGR